MAIVRATALLALLVGCSDGDDDPSTDGGIDGGRPDGGSDGGMDGGGDASADGGGGTDARVDAAADDAGSALTQALLTDGVRADDARAGLVIPAFCTNAVLCNINDAGVTQGVCMTSYDALWMQNRAGGQSTDCLDAQLDLLSCTATTACAQLVACAPFLAAQQTRCAADGG